MQSTPRPHPSLPSTRAASPTPQKTRDQHPNQLGSSFRIDFFDRHHRSPAKMSPNSGVQSETPPQNFESPKLRFRGQTAVFPSPPNPKEHDRIDFSSPRRQIAKFRNRAPDGVSLGAIFAVLGSWASWTTSHWVLWPWADPQSPLRGT